MKKPTKKQNQLIHPKEKDMVKKPMGETVSDRLERKRLDAHKRLDVFYDYKPDNDRSNLLPHVNKGYPIRFPKGTNF